MRILLIEDDRRLSNVLVRAFNHEGFEVDVAYDGDSGSDLLRAGIGDALILDLGLPGRDGLDLLKELRSGGSTLPVVVLTGRDDLEQRVTGLDAGADDYVIKPFQLDELLARVRALLRRTGSHPVLRYADVELDPNTGVATRAGRRLDLRPRELALLECFLQNAEDVLSRERIYADVWEARYDGLSNVIEVYIRYLRNHLEAEGPRLIHTVRGEGYVLHRGEGQ